MFAIKVFTGKKETDWVLLRDDKDYVVYIWSNREEAEAAMKKLDYAKCEITEDIPAYVISRNNEKRDNQKKDESN